MATLKRASRRAEASAKIITQIQPRLLRLAEPPVEDQERRRHAEVDEVGEAVELGAEARGRLQEARDAPVDAVEQGREHDGAQRQLVAPLDPHADRGEARRTAPAA